MSELIDKEHTIIHSTLGNNHWDREQSRTCMGVVSRQLIVVRLSALVSRSLTKTKQGTLC